MQDDHHLGILIEEFRDQNKAVLEAVGQMQQQLTELLPLKGDAAELKNDVKVIKAAVLDQTHQLGDHEMRIIRLEGAR